MADQPLLFPKVIVEIGKEMSDPPQALPIHRFGCAALEAGAILEEGAILEGGLLAKCGFYISARPQL